MKTFIFRFFPLFLLLAACQPKSNETAQHNPLERYISAPSTISKAANIVVSLRNGALFAEDADASIFTFKPSIDGQWVRLSNHEFVFSPTAHLKSGQQYELRVANRKIENLPSEPSTVAFSINVIKQDFEVVLDALRPDVKSTKPAVTLAGNINTSDIASLEDVQKMLSLSDKGQTLEWTTESATRFSFVIGNIDRLENAYNLEMSWNGKSLGVDRREVLPVRIPSLKEFEVTSVRVEGEQSPFVSIHFTDILDSNQDLTGLFTLEGETRPRVVVDGSEVRLYLSQKLTGQSELTIHPGLKNKLGYKLEGKIIRSVSFETPKPEVRLAGKGTIMPSTDGLYLPFETIGVKSVQVSVVRLHESNIPAFFQANDWEGENETVRYGKMVYTGNVDLKRDNALLGGWTRHHLDLTRLFTAEKGAMYRVMLYLIPSDALYPCGEMDEYDRNEGRNSRDWSIHQQDGFNYYSSYDRWYYPPGFEWSERENPCHVSYYNYERSVATNLLATDIGLIAKIGADNQLNVYTTSLASAAPVQADIRVLDFQLQEIASGRTNGDGFYSTAPSRRPFLVVAQAAGQNSYLKLSDASALSTSNFDVAGQEVTKGLKGFIYGERDVWRPGDDIYLSFILEDKKGTIPADYPVAFELRDPSGNIKDQKVSTMATKGIYTFKTSTTTADPTGNWQASVSVGSARFTKRVRIETVKPNRLKIDLGFDQDTYYRSDNRISGLLTAKWLTGVNAPQLQAQISMSYRPVKTQFEGYPNYSFDLLDYDFYEESETIVDRKTDESGALKFDIAVPTTLRPPGKLALRLETKVYEPGGGFSIFNKVINYMPYTAFAGVKVPEGDEYGYLKRNAKHQFEIASVTDKGKPAERQIKVEVFKMEWRWWWDQQYDYEASYISSGDKRPLLSRLVTATNGKSVFTLDGNDLGWGRHMVVVSDLLSAHRASKVFYMGWSEGEKSGIGAAFLSVTTPKDEYKTGEKIEVTLPSSIKGKALITVENGSSVLEQFWIETKQQQSTFSFTATPAMAPNVYLNVTMIQPHAATENDLPIRTYGILPLKVYDPATILEPVIKMEEELSPLKETKITVSEKSGQPMGYTLAIVDEGLLDITGFKTPDPWQHFYQREALGVRSWDLYDHVLGAYGGKLERLLAIGGSDAIDPSKGGKRDARFEPVVQFFGPFELKKGEKRDHSITLPQYIGSVKVMVVAANLAASSGQSAVGQYGRADKAVPVTQPLMVLGTLPRVAGSGESIHLPVNVIRLKNNITNASISVKAEGVIKLVGEGKKDLNLTGETTTGYFALAVDNKAGMGKVTITATSGKDKAEHVINLESRLPNPSQTTVVMKKLAPGEFFDQKVVPFGVEGTNSAILTLSQMPNFDLERKLHYLIRYPHGCVEQVTSAAFPQLYLSDLVRLPVERKIATEQNIKEAIARLQRYQTHEGGFAYWQGYSSPDQWGSIYATHFLSEAKNKGYLVPTDMLKNALKYLKREASGWSKSSMRYNDDYMQGYRLYVLANAGDADQSAMNRMRNTQGTSRLALERLAAAYAIHGRKEVAEEILRASGSASYVNEYWYSYGSEVRDLAMRLETYTALDDQTNAFNLLQSLATKLTNNDGLNTHATAYSLLAISKFASKIKRGDIDATVAINGKTDKWSTSLSLQSGSLPLTTDNSLSVTNRGNGDVFLALTLSGIPLPGNEQAAAQNLSLGVQYTNERGESLIVDKLTVGTSIQAKVTVRNTSAATIRNIALTHILPSGWEINNSRLAGDGDTKESGDHTDIRDDRVYRYFDLQSGQVRTFTVNLTAAYKGKFYLPAISAEAMYDATQYARTEGKWVEVE